MSDIQDISQLENHANAIYAKYKKLKTENDQKDLEGRVKEIMKNIDLYKKWLQEEEERKLKLLEQKS